MKSHGLTKVINVSWYVVRGILHVLRNVLYTRRCIPDSQFMKMAFSLKHVVTC